jgi:hypothetical protein
MNQEFDISAVEGVPSTPLCVAANRPRPKRTRRVAPLRTVLLVAVAVLLALVLVRAALRFHAEYNLLAEVRREGSIYWRSVCNEGHTRPPNSYDQCTRAKTAAHQFTRYRHRHRRRRRRSHHLACSLLAFERVLHLALRDLNPFADCVPGTSCSFVWMKASEAAIRLMDSFASNLTLALGLLSYAVYANAGPALWARVTALFSGKRRQ